MRQLTFIEPGRLEWHDVVAPRIGADTDALVRLIAVARCDLDFHIARGVVRYPGPFAFGHEAVAEVVDAGTAVPFTPGDHVAVPFQLSCGRCSNCRAGLTNTCSHFPFGAAYGLKPTSGVEFGGALSDLMLVPFADHMLVGLPSAVDPVAAASAPDNIADGWRAVAPHLKARPDASVLVIGGGAKSIGLYAAAVAVALKAGRVVYLDDDEDRRRRAAALGTDVDGLGLETGLRSADQFDIVVLAIGGDPALGFAVRSTAPNGVLTSVTIFREPTNSIPLTRAYYKGLTFITGRVHRPAKTAKSQRTKAAILKAAQQLFADQGYERATVRDIAARAAIDPAMVIRYFGSKEGLFARATAFDLKLPNLAAVAKPDIGRTLVAHFLEVWEGSLSNGSLISLLRAAASNEDAAGAVRAIFGGQAVPMLAQVVPPAELPMRAGLVATQVMGLAVTRYILKVPPVVAMERAQIVRLLGPTMQRYVVGKL